MPRSASTLIAAATLAVRVSRSASASRSAPIPLMSWVPFRSARPSFASSTSGSSPTSRRATSAGSGWPASSTRPRPMSGRARWASGARSPDAPTEPCSGTMGWTPSLRKSSSRSTRSGRQPLCPSASVLARSRSIARTTSRGNAAPTPAAWLIRRFSWSRLASAGRHGPGRKRTESGRHAVDDLAGGDESLDDVAGFLHPGAGVRRRARRELRGGRPPRRRRASGPRRSGRWSRFRGSRSGRSRSEDSRLDSPRPCH